MDVDFDSGLIFSGRNKLSSWVSAKKAIQRENNGFLLTWKETIKMVQDPLFRRDWLTYDLFIFLALGCFTLARNHHIQKTSLFAILFNHSSISFTKIHRHKTCINCRVKKMTTWQYIADVKQTPLSWWYHIHQIVAVYWRPWKSAYEIIPVNWKCLAHSTYTFLLLASSKQIPDDLQESHRSENFCKFVPMEVNQTNQMSRTGQQFKQSVN